MEAIVKVTTHLAAVGRIRQALLRRSGAVCVGCNGREEIERANEAILAVVTDRAVAGGPPRKHERRPRASWDGDIIGIASLQQPGQRHRLHRVAARVRDDADVLARVGRWDVVFGRHRVANRRRRVAHRGHGVDAARQRVGHWRGHGSAGREAHDPHVRADHALVGAQADGEPAAGSGEGEGDVDHGGVGVGRREVQADVLVHRHAAAAVPSVRLFRRRH